MYFDSHAHLDSERLVPMREEILAAMRENSVTEVMNVGCDLPSSRSSIALSEQYRFIWAAVGSHPDDAASVDEERIEVYRSMSSHPRVKAIGEIGLDYHYENPARDIQKRAFRLQLELAREAGLPVIIHEREAHADALEILREFPDVTGVFHCFSGSWEMAKLLLDRGWYLGFTGVITFKNARRAVEVAEKAPLDRIVIETDCPYMAPEPFRGKANHPGYVPLMAKKIAEIRGIILEECAAAVRKNAKTLFRITE